jgi:predicted nucleic acid-binding Zn ribbon protein
MECPGCGRYIPEESTVCQYCGHTLKKEKKINRNLIIVFLLAGILVVSLFFNFFQYETENADTLIRAFEKEIDNGSTLLQKAESGLQSLREIQIETIENIRSERDYASQSMEKISIILADARKAETAFERADTFLKRTDDLRLPGWYRQYVNGEKEVLHLYTEYKKTLETISTNYLVYYGFAEHFLAGEQLLVSVMDDIDRGNDHLERGDYTFAKAAYRSASDLLIGAQKEYTAASKLLDLPYITDFLSNVNHLQRALDHLKEAAHQMELENVDEASLLVTLGMQEMQSLTGVNKLQLKIQAANWYQSTIMQEFETLDALKSEIEELEKENVRT